MELGRDTSKLLAETETIDSDIEEQVLSSGAGSHYRELSLALRVGPPKLQI